MKTSLAWSLALLLSATAAQSRDEPPTVEDVADSNGLLRDGLFRVKTPSILSVEQARPVEPDTRIAIDQYERLLELPDADPDTRAEALRRSAYLRLQRADAAGEADGVDVRTAIATYRRLLQEHPGDAYNDRALYQLARAYQLAGDQEAAIDSLRQLGRRYPRSQLAGDGVFRAAELLFGRERYDEAEVEYRTVLALGAQTPFFEPAQYKYGWSLFKQGKHEEALPVFLALLDRELPAGELEDPQGALAQVKKNKLEFTQDALRVTSLSFMALGGGPAVNAHFARAGAEPRYATLVYNALGEQFLEKRRYTDAAQTYSAFIQRKPAHPRAPEFQTKVIAAYQQGGFADLVVQAKEDYVRRYAPGTPYWAGREPDATVTAQLRQHLDELGRHYQALAQRLPESDPRARQSAFLNAAEWYRRRLELSAQDPQAAEVNLLYADALFDGGRTDDAARQYRRTAYDYAGFAKAPEAAYATVQAYQRLAGEVPEAARAQILRQSVEASLQLADRFPAHAQSGSVLTRAAEDLYRTQDHEQAVAVAARALKSPQGLTPEQRRSALAVTADARFAQKQYPQAEAAYLDLLKATAPGSTQRPAVVEQLAASVYHQAEAARTAGDLRAAAAAFLRVGQVAPEASIRANADYDAATAFVALQDWPAAEAALEAFRTRHPTHALIGDADKQLAAAYRKDGKLAPAAAAYGRIAAREGEKPEVRRDAAWLSAQLYDQTQSSVLSSQAYELYLTRYPQPLDRAFEARRRLADLSRDALHDPVRYEYWLQDIVKADTAAGSARGDVSKRAAAQASLELGRIDANKARQLALTLPVDKSLPRRQAATQTAVATLLRAAAYGYAEITTAATYELGMVYRDFGRALLRSERPAKLAGEALEQYELLLEEQAYPFEEKAIEAHEANLARLSQGLWNDWIRKSAGQLAELAPAQYGKNDHRETVYDSLL